VQQVGSYRGNTGRDGKRIADQNPVGAFVIVVELALAVAGVVLLIGGSS
jgi:hypothetical protein